VTLAGAREPLTEILVGEVALGEGSTQAGLSTSMTRTRAWADTRRCPCCRHCWRWSRGAAPAVAT
jgi:hypothetical protein